MKYMGSKARIAKHILPIILKYRKSGQYYVEPFVGGFNCICNVVGNRIGSDANKYLIALFLHLQRGWQPNWIGRETYLHAKENKNDFPDHVVGWIGFGCSYSGKFFAGYAGHTDTKIGTVRDYQAEAVKNLKKQIQGLIGIEIQCSEYQELFIPNNSIIYCDPPYKNTTGYKSGFDHLAFWEWCREKSRQGHTVFCFRIRSAG